MSFSLDANVLIYASDRSSRHFARANSLLEELATGREILYLAWPTLMAYLRISTHPSIFSNPLSPAEAQQNIRTLCRAPRVRLLSEGDDFLEIYEEVTKGQVVRGNLVPDAHLAALLLQEGISTLYSADSDFLRFRFLDVRNPFVD